MPLITSILIAPGVVIAFTATCAFIHRRGLHDVFAAVTTGLFLTSIAWAAGTVA